MTEGDDTSRARVEQTVVLTDRRFLEHDPGPGHPESPARLDAILG